MKSVLRIVLFCIIFSTASAQPWQSWLREFKKEALADGIQPGFFDETFRDIHPSRRVISFDRKQPEKRLTFLKYRNTRADNYRIKIGQREYRKHRPLLEQVGREFGVDPCFIVSLWGMESSYGRFMGKFPVIKSLATLAWDARRADFFRKELLIALHILQDGHVSKQQYVGEWAGASGQPQFLPSSWNRFAVDYDGDGRKDIWRNYGDIFASIANYLAQNGWQKDQPWAMPIDMPGSIDKSQTGFKNKHPISYWRQQGVRPANGYSFPSEDMDAYIVTPYGGPNFLVFNNFRVIMRYNNSTYYAGSIGYMADKICSRPVYSLNTN